MLVPSGDAAALADAIVAMGKTDLKAMGTSGRASMHGHLERSIAGWRTLLTGLASR